MESTYETRVTVTVNGLPHPVQVDNRTSVLDLLRERLGRTGTKKGCDHGRCGACGCPSNLLSGSSGTVVSAGGRRQDGGMT